MSSLDKRGNHVPHGIARFFWSTTKDVFTLILVGCLGAFIVLLILFVIRLEKRPDLNVWHKARLGEEFVADSTVDAFEEYLSLEERLFKQFEERVCGGLRSEDRGLINRFNRGSLADPERWLRNWNRTFEFGAEEPRGGVLLLHGMSDSPYSLRSLGERFHAEGWWVVGLRLPGHGTAPSGLVNVKWEDMAAAVRIGMNRLREKVGDRPLFIVGYSNGGALGVQYALSGLEDETLPRVSALALLSPAIGVPPVAALAVWQARLGHLLGLPKLEWSAIQPEYDPFKYNSFAVNAGDQVYRLTKEIGNRVERLQSKKGLEQFPPLLAFQSAVDGTVSTKALVEGLFARLPSGDHELVIFDVNRISEIERVLLKDPKSGIDTVMREANLPFAVSLVTNQAPNTRKVVVRYKKVGTDEVTENPLDMIWPEGVYSLSHVALPFPENDPLYGVERSEKNPGIHLGNIAFRGERSVLQINAADMLRLRHNPFYSYMERRLLEFLTRIG